jgi:hypothetical protein
MCCDEMGSLRRERVEKRGEFFFLPQFVGEVAAVSRLPEKLEAKNKKDAFLEAKKYGHGIVTMKIGKV